MNEAENVIHGAAIDRDARALRGGKDFHDFLERRFYWKCMHVRTGDHDFTDLQLAEFDGAENELLFSDREQSPFAGLLNLYLKFFGGMGNTMAGGPHDAKHANDGAGDAVKKIDGPAERVEKPGEGASDHEGDAFGASEADGFGYQFAENHVDGAEDREGKSEGGGMGEEEHAHAAVGRQDALEEFCESGLAQGADGKAGQRDADLDAGNDAVKIGEELLDDLGLSASLGHQLANTRKAYGDQRELDGGEEAVQGHQHENSDDPDEEHSVERTSQRHCNSRFGWKEERVDCGCRIERIDNSMGRRGEAAVGMGKLRGVAASTKLKTSTSR